MHAFHDDDVGRAVVPVHLGNLEQSRFAEIAPQLIGVGRLTDQVELVMQVVIKLLDHLQRPQTPRIGRNPHG